MSSVVGRPSLVVGEIVFPLPTSTDCLYQFMQLLLIQILHNFADVLRVLAGGDQECVIRFYDYQIVHTYTATNLLGE